MRLKIRCDGECEKFCKIFWEVNKALDRNLILASHSMDDRNQLPTWPN